VKINEEFMKIKFIESFLMLKIICQYITVISEIVRKKPFYFAKVRFWKIFCAWLYIAKYGKANKPTLECTIIFAISKKVLFLALSKSKYNFLCKEASRNAYVSIG
jgi:hypothetical protein